MKLREKDGGCILPAAVKVAGYFLWIGSAFLLPALAMAQTPEMPSSIAEQQLESITENNDDNETEDDSFLQSMQQFLNGILPPFKNCVYSLLLAIRWYWHIL
jgi:hypothetical protein